MRQHLTPEQFDALPDPQLGAFISWCTKREEWTDPDFVTRLRKQVALTVKDITIGVLLELLNERGWIEVEAVILGGWRVSALIGCTVRTFTASDLIDALWAAVCAVLEREASHV